MLTEFHLQVVNLAVKFGVLICLLWCVRPTGLIWREYRFRKLTNRLILTSPSNFRVGQPPRSSSAHRNPVSPQTKRVSPKKRKTRGPPRRPLPRGQPPLLPRHLFLRTQPETSRNLHLKNQSRWLLIPNHRLHQTPSHWLETLRITTSPNC